VGIYKLDSLGWGRFMREAGATPTVVKFYADGCPKCRAAEETYRELGKIHNIFYYSSAKFYADGCPKCRTAEETYKELGTSMFP